jgi:hypothetical protein
VGIRQTERYFGNGRAVRNLFGEMKVRLARRLMESYSGESIAIDKQTLITFALEDVPGQDLSESLFEAFALSQNEPQHRESGIVTNVDPTLPE